jgi:hypothetical protein
LQSGDGVKTAAKQGHFANLVKALKWQDLLHPDAPLAAHELDMPSIIGHERKQLNEQRSCSGPSFRSLNLQAQV